MITDTYEMDDLIKMDLRKSVDHLELFIHGLPYMVRLIGVEAFRKEMGFSKPQYYRRVKNANAWKIEELKKAIDIIAKYKV